ncbi:MAG: tripartite tricarboxylate transporter TctB family protein [Xanthobacteraceae bacterium]|nr:tripartite tricarboxylate transporter TctB family protein [Xanthobacteraceae bacterium]
MKSSGFRVNNAELWGGAIWFAVSLFVLEQGRRLGLGTVNAPGMGFMMFWLGIVMAGLSLGVAAQSIRSEGPSIRALWAGTRWVKTLIVIVAFVLYAYAFTQLGFLLSTIPLMLVLLRAIDPVRWVIALPLAFGAPLLIWWVLERVLQIQLPTGVFEIG